MSLLTAPDRTDARRAIVDIGSNSLRLVIYAAPSRVPVILYNEKVAVGLGRNLAASGEIGSKAFSAGVAACRRFVAVLKAAGVRDVRTVATAAARDARDGPDFLKAVRATGLKPQLLRGEEEAIASAPGRPLGLSRAAGIAGDIGGGSLELVDLSDGRLAVPPSFPLGTLRLPALRGKNGTLDGKAIRRMLTDGGWPPRAGNDRLFFGGRDRARARCARPPSARRARAARPRPCHPGRSAGIAACSDRRAGHRRTASDSRHRQCARADARRSGGVVRSARRASGHREFRHLGVRPARRSVVSVARSGRAKTRSADRRRAGVAAAFGTSRLGRRGRGRLDCTACLPTKQNREASIRVATCLVSGGGLEEESEARAEHALDVALLGAWVGIDARGSRITGAGALHRLGRQGATSGAQRYARTGHPLGRGDPACRTAWREPQRAAVPCAIVAREERYRADPQTRPTSRFMAMSYASSTARLAAAFGGDAVLELA